MDTLNMKNDQITEEYIIKMAAKGRGEDIQQDDEINNNNNSDTVPLPEGGLEQFYNKENGEYDWRAHALSLKAEVKPESEQENISKKIENEIKNEVELKSVEEVRKFLLDAKLDPMELNKRIIDNGDIDEVDYVALERVGVPRGIVKNHVNLARKELERNQQDAINYIGGEEATARLLQWASQNLSTKDKQIYNDLLAGSNYKIALDVLRSLQSVTNVKATERNLIEAQENSFIPKLVGYRSRHEMTEDMRNPKYSRSPTFRDEVAMKIKNATWISDN